MQFVSRDGTVSGDNIITNSDDQFWAIILRVENDLQKIFIPAISDMLPYLPI
ncbi:hypothetical protein WN48_04948 [Eufriesea mexicana]|uniref:Uncharacterized protein n=1 Tax=Eufriesea mexicana TaxID=516756 RepID=A0A310SDI5_9HYME|nr:hypothetical protein WN48_04948 [Eufriesea mexicana]